MKTMIEYGKVLSVKGDYATVLIERSAMCGDCGACQVGRENLTKETNAKNLVNAKPDQMVAVEMEFVSLFKASMIAYGLPLIALLLGFVVGWVLAPSLHWDQVLISFFCGIFLTALCYFGIHLCEKQGVFKSKYEPAVTEVLPEGFVPERSCKK